MVWSCLAESNEKYLLETVDTNSWIKDTNYYHSLIVVGKKK